ncbi:MAG: polysaccharide deacetylase family protein [Proteobacteria bacterium]|nr:polysaccharide deacetylase family protein [Pseudomonadota bacterium]
MSRSFKTLALVALKSVGAFRLARLFMRRRLRILGYHGIWIPADHHFGDKLFMSPQTFEGRLALLQRDGYRVLTLDEAVAALDNGNLPADSVVITIDDGWYSTYRHALPALRRFGFPATVYATTLHVVEKTPVFNLVVQYMFKRTAATEADLSVLGMATTAPVPLLTAGERQRAIDTVNDFCATVQDPELKRSLMRKLGVVLGIDFDRLEEQRWLGLMTIDEIRDAAAQGFDIQLHTHRHTMPVSDQPTLALEIEQNRSVLRSAIGAKANLVHFCYPSGVYHPRVFPWLRDLGVASATTVAPGLNDKSTPRLELRRFLDGEFTSAIEFEAELSGVAEIMRQARSRLQRVIPVLRSRVVAEQGSPLRATKGPVAKGE